jgi:LPS export ABC transporter protein LptC
MRADHGTQLNGRNLVKLKGGVVVKQNSTEDPKFSRMESEEVTILIDEEYLESDHPISFTTESSLTSSIGAQAWLKTGKIILLQESAGTYRSAIKKDNSDKGDDTSNNTTEK